MTTRIQRKRTKGYRLPAGAVCVTRPGPWGNPFTVEEAKGWPLCGETVQQAVVNAHRWWLMFDAAGKRTYERAKDELRGKALACFCKTSEPCHGDNLAAAADGRLWRGWCELDKNLVRIKRVGRKYSITVFEIPSPISCFYFQRTYDVPRQLLPGRTVLGLWTSPEMAIDAARDMLNGDESPRVCSLADIDRVRRENAKARA